MYGAFVQGHSDGPTPRSCTSGGAGLGLLLVRTLAELHGGRASAHSDGPGRGAEFALRLPRLIEV